MTNPSAPVPLKAGQGDGHGPASAQVCPKCRRRFPEKTAYCPDDQTPLVRAQDMIGSEGDPMVGRTLDGRFTVLAKLGAGSMGTVYRARQNAINRDVAIKILRSDRAMDATAKARFLREARANSVLASPHTVTVFDFGQSESGEFYLAMEMLEGESLGQRLQRVRRLPVDLAVETARQALRSLAEAHAKGIIHRDLKPDNLFYARVKHGQGDAGVEEIVKVLDFGIAKMIGSEDAPMNAVETQAGTVFGTPRYMSPEQAQGKPLDARSDLYSLGVILYQMLTGRPPFTDNDAIVVMARHIKTAPKSPTEACPEANIPLDLETAVMRALAKDPKQRPASAEQMSADLARALDLGAAVSSGVRSVRPGAMATGMVPPVTVQGTPGAPASQGAGAGLSSPVDALQSSVAIPPELAPSGRRKKLVMALVGGAVALAVLAGIAAASGGSKRASAPAVTAAPAAPAAAAPAADPAWTPIPAAPEGANVDAPVVSADSLPRASSASPAVAPAPPAAAPHRPSRAGAPRPPSAPAAQATHPAAAPPPPPAPAASSRYGIFE